MSRAGPAALALAAVLAAPAAPAQPAPPRPLRYDPAADGAVAGTAALSWLALAALGGGLSPLSCRWCEPSALDEGVQAALLWGDPRAADVASTAVGIVALPLGLLAFGFLSARRAGDRDAFWADTLVIAEAVSLAGLLNGGVKLLAARQRPHAFYGRQPSYDDPRDRNVSFYSGHTSFAFSAAAAAGTVYWIRGYRGAGWALGGGLAAAALTGYLRIAADKHWLTDVLVGAAAGGLVGWATPRFFHREGGAGAGGMQLRSAPLGIALAF